MKKNTWPKKEKKKNNARAKEFILAYGTRWSPPWQGSLGGQSRKLANHISTTYRKQRGQTINQGRQWTRKAHTQWHAPSSMALLLKVSITPSPKQQHQPRIECSNTRVSLGLVPRHIYSSLWKMSHTSEIANILASPLQPSLHFQSFMQWPLGFSWPLRVLLQKPQQCHTLVSVSGSLKLQRKSPQSTNTPLHVCFSVSCLQQTCFLAQWFIINTPSFLTAGVSPS